MNTNNPAITKREQIEKEKAEQIAATLNMYAAIKTAQPVTLDQVAPKEGDKGKD